jgi:NSS family neurotransmitter:Na+ symporter
MSRFAANTLVSVILLVIGLLYTTRGGLYWLDIVDKFLNSFALPAVGMLQCIAIGWIYGAPKLREHVNLTSDFKIGLWWDVCIKYVTPILLLIMLDGGMVKLISEGYGGYPGWALYAGGWRMLILITAVAIILAKAKGNKSHHEEEVAE